MRRPYIPVLSSGGASCSVRFIVGWCVVTSTLPDLDLWRNRCDLHLSAGTVGAVTVAQAINKYGLAARSTETN